MNNKRFKYEYDTYNGNLIDTKYQTFYPVEDTEENINLLCERLNELCEENAKFKAQQNNRILDLIHSLDSIGYRYYFNDNYRLNSSQNIYHRTCNQLEKYLKRNGFLINNVSRCHIGRKEYYNLEFNASRNEWAYDKTSDTQIKKLLNIEKIGLVDFYEHDDIIHEIILIDEEELNDKYLKDGNLIFK